MDLSLINMSMISIGPLMSKTERKHMAILKGDNKELLFLDDKELSFLVYSESSHNDIKLYKDDVLCLMYNINIMR